MPIAIAVLGLGAHAFKHTLPAIARQPGLFTVAVGWDRDYIARTWFESLYSGTKCVSDVRDILNSLNENKWVIQCAYVAVPHSEHYQIVMVLLTAEIHVLKEKPVALSLVELQRLGDVARVHGTRLSTAIQARYSHRSRQIKEWIPFIGDLHLIEGVREMHCLDLGEGWRAQR